MSATQTRIEITGNIVVHHPIKPHAAAKCRHEWSRVMRIAGPLIRMCRRCCAVREVAP